MRCTSFAHLPHTSNPLLYSEVPPDAQVTFRRKTSHLSFGWQKTQRIGTRHLFASFSADQTQGKSNTFSSYVNSLDRHVQQIYRSLKMAFELYSAAGVPTLPSLLPRLPKSLPI